MKMDNFPCTWCNETDFTDIGETKTCKNCNFQYLKKTVQNYKVVRDRVFVTRIVPLPKDTTVPFSTVRQFGKAEVPIIIERKVNEGKPRQIWIPLGIKQRKFFS